MLGPRVVLLVVAVVVLASGCGGSTVASVPELESAVVLARDRTDYVLARITRAESEGDFLERMDEAADAIDDAARDLDRIGVSKDRESEVGDLVESLHQLAFDVQATADQIREPGFGDLLTGTRGLSFESWSKVNLALAVLRKEGIEVAPLERH